MTVSAPRTPLAPELATAAVDPPLRRRRRLRTSWGVRRRRSGVLDVVTTVLVAVVVLTAIVGPWIAPDVFVSHITESFRAPSAQHWFGTDQQGRDVFWRVVVGARQSVLSAVLVVLGYAVVSILLATVATLGPRWLDDVVMRITDAVMAFPSMLFALAVTAALGAGLDSVLLALVATGWPISTRLLRGLMRETAALPFVEGARTLGVSRTRLMLRHVLPNSMPALVTKWTGDVGNTIIVIGGLSFIGAGAQPPSAEWGASVAAARSFVSSAWWIALFPGLAIAVATAAFGLLGDVLNVRSDPALRARVANVAEVGR